MTLLLCIVTVPSLNGNFNIPCAVDGTTWIFLIPVLPIIPLCWDADLITMKFIHAEVECSSSLIFTSRDIWPIGQMVSLLNPMRDVVAGIIWLLIFGRILMKQCLYRTSEDAPPSTYIRCTKCPPISASMIIGPSVPSSSPKDRKEITVSGEKLWVRILQKSQESGQSLANTNTRTDRVHKSREFLAKVNLGVHVGNPDTSHLTLHNAIRTWKSITRMNQIDRKVVMDLKVDQKPEERLLEPNIPSPSINRKERSLTSKILGVGVV
ncbi:hypothetical protein Tco_0546567 [Tanacetum coccineum]